MALTTMGPQKAVRPVSLLASCRVEDRRVGASVSAGGMYESPGSVGDARWSARNDDAAPRLNKALLASRRQGLALEAAWALPIERAVPVLPPAAPNGFAV